MLVCFDGPLLELSAPLQTLDPCATLHYIFMYTRAHRNANGLRILADMINKLISLNVFVKIRVIGEKKLFSWSFFFTLSVEMEEFPECKKFTHSVFHLHVLSAPR